MLVVLFWGSRYLYRTEKEIVRKEETSPTLARQPAVPVERSVIRRHCGSPLPGALVMD